MRSSLSPSPSAPLVHARASGATTTSPSAPTQPSEASRNQAVATPLAGLPANTRAALTEPGARPPSPARARGVPSLAQMAFRTFEKNVDLKSALENWELERDSGHTYAPALTAACLDHILAHLPEVRASTAWVRLRDGLVAGTAAQVTAYSQSHSGVHAGWRGREDVLLQFLADMGIERAAEVLPVPTLEQAAWGDLPQIVDWYLRQPIWSEGSPSPLLRDVRFDRDAVVTSLQRENPPAAVLRVLLSFLHPEAIKAWVNRTGPWEGRYREWRCDADGAHLSRCARAGDLDLLKTLLSHATPHRKDWATNGTALFLSAWRSGHVPTIEYVRDLLTPGALVSALESRHSSLASAISQDPALLDVVAPKDAWGRRTALAELSRRGKKAFVGALIDAATEHFVALFLEVLAATETSSDRCALFRVDYGAPFLKAIVHGDRAVVERLLAQARRDGADWDTLKASNYRAFALAASLGKTDILRHFLEVLEQAGSLANAKSADEHAALFVAVKNGHVDAVDLLLAEEGYLERALDARVGMEEYERHALFGHAARGGHAALFERLLLALPDDASRRAVLSDRHSHLQLLLHSGAPDAIALFFRLADRFGMREAALTCSDYGEPYQRLGRLAGDRPAAFVALLDADALTLEEKTAIVTANNGNALYGLTREGSAADLRKALRHASPEQAQAILGAKHLYDPWDAAVVAVLRGGVEFLDAWLDACGDFDATPLLDFLNRAHTQRRERWTLDDAQRARLAKLLPQTTTQARVIALAAHYGDVPTLTRYMDNLLPAPAPQGAAVGGEVEDEPRDDAMQWESAVDSFERRRSLRDCRRTFLDIVAEGVLKALAERGQVEEAAQLLRLAPSVVESRGYIDAGAVVDAMVAAGEQHTAEADAVAGLICEAAPEPQRAALRAAQARGARSALPVHRAASLLDTAAPTHAAGAIAQAWASIRAYDSRNPDDDRSSDRDERDRAARTRDHLAGLLFERADDPTIRAALFNQDRASMLKRAQDGDLRLVAQLERLHSDLATHFVTTSGVTMAELTALKDLMPPVHAALLDLATDKASAVLGVSVGLTWAENPRQA
jgi:hypothetical protein